jgi:hypothetical protein
LNIIHQTSPLGDKLFGEEPQPGGFPFTENPAKVRMRIVGVLQGRPVLVHQVCIYKYVSYYWNERREI